jgi:DNA gyrase/topoisomerase IV subunit B
LINYDANSIETLDFRTAIRSRIAMYMGSADNQGVLQCIREIITNSIDEATMGFGNEIGITLYKDNRIKIYDKGRGCPFGIREDGTEALEAIYTMAHSGAKFNDKIFQNVAGMNGIGAKGVALSSSHFQVWSYRDGKEASLWLKDGIKEGFEINDLPLGDKTTGTVVEFIPSQEVYNLESININFEEIKKMCRDWSYLSKGVSFKLWNKETNEKITYCSKNGLLDFMKDEGGKSLNKTPLHIEIKENNIEAEIVMEWTDSRQERSYVFTNGLENIEGGTSLTGIKTALTNFFKKKLKGEASPEILRKGLFYAVSCKIPNPSFANQTKTKVNNPELRGLCQRATTQMLEDFENRRRDEFEKIVELLTKELKAEYAAERARKQVLDNEKEQTKIQKTKILNVDKLCDARKLGEDSILLLCEGLSAGGSMKIGRDADKYGILMLRGKCKNLLNCTIEEGLQNEEVKLFQQALGIIYGKKSTSMRYGKIAIASDSDFDGSHIGLLIMVMAQVICPSILTENRLYWLKAPIYKVETKSKTYFYYTEEEFAKHPQGIITKYKGLGQMNDVDLKNSMFNDEWQRLEPISFNEEGLKLLIDLMGDNVEHRKEFVYNYIDFNKFNIE